MPILLRNSVGKAYPVYVDTEVTDKVSEGSEVSFTMTENENTYAVINAVSKMWIVTNVGGPDDYNEYIITMIDRFNARDKKKVTIKAVSKYRDDMKVTRFYDNMTGSRTPKAYFTEIFKVLRTKDKAYKFNITQGVPSSSWENAGDGDSIEEMFNNGLQRYGLEYEYDPKTKTFTLKPYVSKDVGYYISSKVNANNIKVEEDAGEGYTYIRGYGNYDDDTKFQEGALQIIFEHPLINIIGKREAPPLKDGRIKQIDTMKSKLEAIVDSSLKVSLSLDFIYLKKHFPNAVARPGDIVPVREDVTDISQDARIIEVTTKRDVYNQIKAQDVVLGDFRRRERHKNDIKKATTFVNALSGGGGGGSPAKQISNLKEQTNVFSSATKKVLNLTSNFIFDNTGIKSVDDDKSVKFGTNASIITSNDDGKTNKTIINGDGLNIDVIPVATDKNKGLLSSEDKVKYDNQIDKVSNLTNQYNTLNNSFNNLISDTGWIDYAVVGVEKNLNFPTDGFKCGYRKIIIGNKTISSIRVNLTNITHNTVVATLPANFVQAAQTFVCRTMSNQSPILGELRKDGRLLFNVHVNDQSTSGLWIYQEHTWIE